MFSYLITYCTVLSAHIHTSIVIINVKLSWQFNSLDVVDRYIHNEHDHTELWIETLC